MTALRTIKRISVALIGGTVFLIGLALIVLPGPAFIVIPAGLAILALEFAWAKRWLRKAQDLLRKKAGTDTANRAGLQVLGSVKGRFIQLVTGAAWIAGFALLVFAGVLVVAIPIGLALLFLAFAETRRGVVNVCSRLLGRNPLPLKEVT
jgi:tellurite resistance protein TerC